MKTFEHVFCPANLILNFFLKQRLGLRMWCALDLSGLKSSIWEELPKVTQNKPDIFFSLVGI